MLFKGSRKRLCFVLTIIIAVGISMFTMVFVARATICNQAYVERFLCSKEVNEYCSSVYNERIALLSENSGIPVGVFELDADDDNNAMAVKRFFDGSDTSLLIQDRIDTYETRIREYLDGNEYDYNDEAVSFTALKAAEIYSDSFGLKDTEDFRYFISSLTGCFEKVSSAGLALILIGCIFIAIMYSEFKKAARYFASAAISSGAGMVLCGIMSFIFGFGKSLQITPIIYQNAIFKAINVMIVIVMVIGVIIIGIAIPYLLRNFKLTKKTRNS